MPLPGFVISPDPMAGIYGHLWGPLIGALKIGNMEWIIFGF